MKKYPKSQENQYQINFSSLDPFADQHSSYSRNDPHYSFLSSEDINLGFGKLEKLYSKKGEFLDPGKTRFGRSNYYAKKLLRHPKLEAEKLAVITSRQIENAVNSSENQEIKIAKQRLYNDKNGSVKIMASKDVGAIKKTNPPQSSNHSNNKREESFDLHALIAPQIYKNYQHQYNLSFDMQALFPSQIYKNYQHQYNSSFDLQALSAPQSHKNYQYQYLLGMYQIAGESDCNPANFTQDESGNLVAFDIGGPSSAFGNRYIGCFLFWKDLLESVDQNFPETAIGKRIQLSQAFKKDYFGEEYYSTSFSLETRVMSYPTIASFINGNIEDCDRICQKYSNDISFGGIIERKFSLIKPMYQDVTIFINSAESILRNTSAEEILFSKIKAYIDGAVDFYYNSPSAKIEKKHILATSQDELNKNIKTLSKIHDKTFDDFRSLIRSFNNEGLTKYLDSSIAKQNGIVEEASCKEGIIQNVKEVRAMKRPSNFPKNPCKTPSTLIKGHPNLLG